MRMAEQPALDEALKKLETALLTPVVSGELAGWVQAVKLSSQELGVQLNDFLQSEQRRQYRQIAAEDAELLVRVQRLASEDEELIAAHKEFALSLDKLAEMVSVADRHESRAEEQRSDLEKRGTDLILRIRRHQVATDTWLNEAFYRDRGTVD